MVCVGAYAPTHTFFSDYLSGSIYPKIQQKFAFLVRAA